jgi:O-antigen/teichoic acid export membrane protein
MFFISFCLRGGSALAKLIFVLYLGHFNYDSLLGQFALFATITAVFTQVAGLEINQTIGRKLHAIGDEERKKLFLHQIIASLIAYAIISSAIVTIYYNLLGVYWILGLAILYLEHYTTELYRLYILKLRPLKAALLLFIKNFGWVALFIALHYFGVISANIQFILIFWLAFLMVSSIIGNQSFEISTDIKKSLLKNGSFKYTRKLVWSSRFFILSALAVALIGAIDKLLIGKFFGTEQLGRYYLYQTVASIPALMVAFSIGATLWPRCIKLAATGSEHEYVVLWRRLNALYWMVITSVSLAISILMPFALNMLGRPSDDLSIFYILLASSAAFVLCEPYKLNLYTGGKDHALVIGNILQLILVIAFVMVGLILGKIEAVAIGVLFANILSLFLYHLQVPIKIASIKA